MATELRVNTAAGSEVSDHLRVLLLKTYEQAVKGNLSASRMLLGIVEKGLAKQAGTASSEDDLSEDEGNVLATLLSALAPGDIEGTEG